MLLYELTSDGIFACCLCMYEVYMRVHMYLHVSGHTGVCVCVFVNMPGEA